LGQMGVLGCVGWCAENTKPALDAGRCAMEIVRHEAWAAHTGFGTHRPPSSTVWRQARIFLGLAFTLSAIIRHYPQMFAGGWCQGWCQEWVAFIVDSWQSNCLPSNGARIRIPSPAPRASRPSLEALFGNTSKQLLWYHAKIGEKGWNRTKIHPKLAGYGSSCGRPRHAVMRHTL
jgi:hypothetical protein